MFRRELIAGAAVALALAAAGCDESTTGPATYSVELSAAPASIAADGEATITAQVMNSLGQTPPGMIVEWSNSLATLQITAGATDNQGRTTATLFGQGTHAVVVVTATLVARPEARDQLEVRVGLD